MTRTSTAKIEIRRWKAHACAGCGCRYAYLMVRKSAFGGATPEQAAEKAQAAADRALAREVDGQPCPTCGLYQPDMIAAPRCSLHRWMLLLAVLGMGMIACLYLGDALQANQALAWAMAEVALIAALGFAVDFRNPNRDLEANRRDAAQGIAAQRVRTLMPGTPPATGSRLPARRGRGLLAVGLVAAALAALALPEWIRHHSDWALNANWNPPVVGPGDEAYLYLPDSISSIKGYWTGASRVTAKVLPEPKASQMAPVPQAGQFGIASSTRQADWGRLDPASHGNRLVPQRPWVSIKLPSGGEYAGKTLVCKVELSVRYPIAGRDDRCETAIDHFWCEQTLRLAAPLAARTYRAWWWSGFAAGAAGLALSILARLRGAEALRRTAGPTEILGDTLAK